MDKYDVIKKIMDAENRAGFGKPEKVYYIEMFLIGWYTEEDIKWIWEGWKD